MLRVEPDGRVLRITLARPERRNAFDAALIAALTEAFADVGDARADVGWQRASIALDPEQNVEDALRLYRMMEAVRSCPAPLVARVHGHALGGGAGLAACADVVVAGRDAVFGFPEVRLGIAPAVISPFVLARVGSRARRFFLTGERFGAETALRIGLADEVADDLDEAVERLVGEVLQAGPEAARAAKRLTGGEPGEELARLAAGLRAGAEGQEGLRAFLERRRPSWR